MYEDDGVDGKENCVGEVEVEVDKKDKPELHIWARRISFRWV